MFSGESGPTNMQTDTSAEHSRSESSTIQPQVSPPGDDNNETTVATTSVDQRKNDSQRVNNPDEQPMQEDLMRPDDCDKLSEDGAANISCVLCMENMKSRNQLEKHLTEVIQRLTPRSEIFNNLLL